MDKQMEDRIRDAAKQFPNPEGVVFSYGTAGFRTAGERLTGVAFRMGLLMAMRGRAKKGAVGVVVSASHNPHQDNGMKLLDAGGAMLDQSWEPVAERIANASTPDDIVSALGALAASEKATTDPFQAKVFIGRDTRITGPTMMVALAAGIKACGAEPVTYGVSSTPQIHYYVWASSQKQTDGGPIAIPTEAEYIQAGARACKTLMGSVEGKPTKVIVDCSNGVGHLKLVKIAKVIEGVLDVEARNGDMAVAERLNNNCGADFIQKEKVSPAGFDADKDSAFHLASLDGDADRLVYFYYAEGGDRRLLLLDGDRIAVLFSTYIKSLLDACGTLPRQPSIGIVQTAYANGASTTYIRTTLGIPVALTPTGVKHLHHKALDYDIGVYFEANGHGTVVFSDKFRAELKSVPGEAAQKLLAVGEMASPVCGDAIYDMLLCEAALKGLGWGIKDWAQLYPDAPSRMTKVKVPDPQLVKTTWDQTQTTAPEGLQAAIDEAVSKFAPGSRAFVRPSGTEPIVRVYAESDTQQNADALAAAVDAIVLRILS